MRNDQDFHVEKYADLLDTKFRIPGTRISFGIDFLIGLIPGLGDIVGLVLSSILLFLMVVRGASGRALALMILNVCVDAIFGSIPVIGDIFDLFFKANKRNLDLYQAHFDEGAHQGSAWPVVVGVLFVLCAVFIGIVWLVIWLFGEAREAVFG